MEFRRGSTTTCTLSPPRRHLRSHPVQPSLLAALPRGPISRLGLQPPRQRQPPGRCQSAHRRAGARQFPIQHRCRVFTRRRHPDRPQHQSLMSRCRTRLLPPRPGTHPPSRRSHRRSDHQTPEGPSHRLRPITRTTMGTVRSHMRGPGSPSGHQAKPILPRCPPPPRRGTPTTANRIHLS